MKKSMEIRELLKKAHFKAIQEIKKYLKNSDSRIYFTKSQIVHESIDDQLSVTIDGIDGENAILMDGLSQDERTITLIELRTDTLVFMLEKFENGEYEIDN